MSHELYASFIPQAKKLYDMLGYAYELVPDASRRSERGEERAEEDELLREVFVSSARFFSCLKFAMLIFVFLAT
jgi:hypothetical protein